MKFWCRVQTDSEMGNEIPRWKWMETIGGGRKEKQLEMRRGGKHCWNNQVKVLDSNNEHNEINVDKQDRGNMNYSQEHCKILGASVKPFIKYTNCCSDGEFSINPLLGPLLPLLVLCTDEYKLRNKKHGEASHYPYMVPTSVHLRHKDWIS